MVVTDVNSSDFEQKVLKSDIPVIVDMWAEWCGPCRVLSPILEELSEDPEFKGRLAFYKLNVDDNPDIAMKYDVMAIPTVLLIINGKVKAQLVGAYPKNRVVDWIKRNL
ncbi:MAG: thioredoxin [Candidatus Micrarchaeota archaeon]|nr:MAG: thioredoxin [Candidatus Micrarchaeota archaeon]